MLGRRPWGHLVDRRHDSDDDRDDDDDDDNDNDDNDGDDGDDGDDDDGDGRAYSCHAGIGALKTGAGESRKTCRPSPKSPTILRLSKRTGRPKIDR